MTDLHDTSAIPDTPAQWDGLAERIMDRATSRAAGLGWLGGSLAARKAVALGLAASIVLAVVRARSEPHMTNLGGDWTLAMAPADSMGRVIAASEGPPSIGMLLFSEPTIEGTR